MLPTKKKYVFNVVNKDDWMNGFKTILHYGINVLSLSLSVLWNADFSQHEQHNSVPLMVCI